MMGETTSLTKATNKSDSLRTTVPKGIVRQFELKEGDKLNWKLEVNNGKICIKVNMEKLQGED